MANTYQGACGRVPSVRPGANFKEAVCIDTNRVYDSVSDKNCLEDLQVTFPDDVQSIVNNCCSLKLKEVEVENVYMDVEPIPFNKGFYTVDITFFFQAKQLPRLQRSDGRTVDQELAGPAPVGLYLVRRRRHRRGRGRTGYRRGHVRGSRAALLRISVASWQLQHPAVRRACERRARRQ